MEKIQTQLDEFFDEYVERFNKSLNGKIVDVDGTVKAFAESFIEANPNGVVAGNNDAQFREAIPHGYAYYTSIGTQSMEILNKEITSLDEFHSMVKVHWLAVYKRVSDSKKIDIEFDVIYFVQHRGEEFKIFAYITGDEQRVLKEEGLIE